MNSEGVNGHAMLAHAALVIIDVQKAIDDPVWGRRGQPDMEKRLSALLKEWRQRNLPVVHVRHDSTDAGSPYLPGKPGNAFKAEVEPLEHEPIVEKRTNSAFIGTDMMDVLEELGVSTLVIGGVLLENSVEATVRMAGNLGFSVLIPDDCVASIDRTDRNGKTWPAEDVYALSLAVLDGEYAQITNSEALTRMLP